MSDLPLRAGFDRVDGFDPATLLGLALPVPVPVPRDPHPTGLPARVVVEVDADDVRILGAGGEPVLETWPRGALVARVDQFDRASVDLTLRWPEDGRAGKLRAMHSPGALAVAELLARDTRVAAGGEAAADDALLQLAATTLPERLRADHAGALRAATALLAPGERPLLLAVARFGALVLTDRALSWWSGGRKEPIVLPRTAIRAIAAGIHLGTTSLFVVLAGEEPVVLGDVEPPERAAEIAAAVPPRAGLDALVGADDDLDLLWRIRRELAIARPLWEPGERGELLASAAVGFTGGAAVLTDRRLLWVPRKGEAVAVARADVTGAMAKRRLNITSVDVERRDAPPLRFESIDPRERAEAFARLLGPRGG